MLIDERTQEECVVGHTVLFFIPPYSPELSPQECQSRYKDQYHRQEERAINKKQLKGNIDDFMNKRKVDKPQVGK